MKKKNICSSCLTGKYSYELDRSSVVCPHIGHYKEGKCAFYKPVQDLKKDLGLDLKSKFN